MSEQSNSAVIRVLIADDQAVIRAGYTTILGAQADIEVVGEAANGHEAVARAQQLQPDVIVMDVRMPELDGIAATEQLAGPGADQPTRVLIITTFHLDEYVYLALRAGASGFLLKDASPAQLIDAVRTVASGEALLAPAVTRRLIGRYAQRLRPANSDAATDPGLASLTSRELDVLRELAQGKTNAEIAAALFVSHETVKTYVSRILTKLGLRDRVQAVVYAYRTGLVADN